jgi:hypothetical protein
MVVVGEIIQVPSLLKYEGQQTAEFGAIRFGSFLKVKIEENVYVVVTVSDISINNPSINTFPRPKRIDQDKIVSLFPDLFEQFPTITTLEVLGYVEKNKVYQDIPPLPPKIYSSIETMSDPEIFQFHQDPNSNTALMNYILRLRDESSIVSTDSLIRKMIEKVAQLFSLDAEKILRQLK